MADPSLDHRIGSSTLGASLNLAKLCIGSGILALPFATAKGGLLVSPLIMATIAVWNGWACSLMMECKNAVVDRSLSLPTASTYSRIALAGLGKVGMAVTDVSVVLTLLGVCVAYQITFASLVHDLLGPIPALSLPSLALASGLLAFPLSCAGDVGALSWLSLAGLLCLCVGVMAILSSGLQAFGWETWQHPLLSSVTGEQLSLFPESSSALAAFIGITTFCFGLCSLAFPVEESMEHKADFPIAVRWSLLAVWLMYVLLGDGAALLYLHHPQGISGNILSDLPRSSVAAALVKLSMASVRPLPSLPCAPFLLQLTLTADVRADVPSYFRSCCTNAGANVGGGVERVPTHFWGRQAAHCVRRSNSAVALPRASLAVGNGVYRRGQHCALLCNGIDSFLLPCFPVLRLIPVAGYFPAGRLHGGAPVIHPPSTAASTVGRRSCSQSASG